MYLTVFNYCTAAVVNAASVTATANAGDTGAVGTGHGAISLEDVGYRRGLFPFLLLCVYSFHSFSIRMW